MKSMNYRSTGRRSPRGDPRIGVSPRSVQRLNRSRDLANARYYGNEPKSALPSQPPDVQMGDFGATWNTAFPDTMAGAPPDVQRSFVQNAPPDALAQFRRTMETPVGSLTGLTDIDLRGYADGGLVRGRGPGFASDAQRTLYDESYAGARVGGVGMGNMGARYDEAFADGGLVQGPGTSTSDSILARLSKDEYVLPKESVELAGLSQLEQLRQDGLALRGQEASATAPRDEQGLMMLAQGTTATDYQRLMEEDERRKEEQRRAEAQRQMSLTPAGRMAAAARQNQSSLTQQYDEAIPNVMNAFRQTGNFLGQMGQRTSISEAAKAAIDANAQRRSQYTLQEGDAPNRFGQARNTPAINASVAAPPQPTSTPSPAADSALPEANPFAKMSDEALQAQLARAQSLLQRMGGSLNPSTPEVQDYQALQAEMRQRNQQRPEGPAFQGVTRLEDLQRRAALPAQGQRQGQSTSGRPSMDQAVADAMDLMINGQRAKSYQGLKVWSTENDNAWDRQVRAQAAQALSALSPYYQGATKQEAERFELERARRLDALQQAAMSGDLKAKAQLQALRSLSGQSQTQPTGRFKIEKVPMPNPDEKSRSHTPTVDISVLIDSATGHSARLDPNTPTMTSGDISKLVQNRNNPQIVQEFRKTFGDNQVMLYLQGLREDF